MSSQIAYTPLQGPMTYDFGDATPSEWPQGEYVPKAVYEALVAELASEKEVVSEVGAAIRMAIEQNQRLSSRIKALEAALETIANGDGAGGLAETERLQEIARAALTP